MKNGIDCALLGKSPRLHEDHLSKQFGNKPMLVTLIIHAPKWSVSFYAATKIISSFTKRVIMGVFAKSDNSCSPKTIELIIYASSKLKDKATYGVVLLEKTLYICDSMCYLKTGRPITDFKYIKQVFGPTPDPAQYLPVRDKLVASGELEIIKEPYYNTFKKKIIPRREPNIVVFEKEEIVLIDEVINWFGDRNATEVSNFTHDLLAWQLAQKNEELPFFTFLLTSKSPTEKDREESMALVKKYLASNQKE